MTKTVKMCSLALAMALTLTLLSACKKQEEAKEEKSGLILDYATSGVIELQDPDALQKAFDEAQRESLESMFSLEYQESAFSEDGKTFHCYIGNSAYNTDDIFISIYMDAELTDEVYMSQLLRPGMAFDTIELNRTLEPGDYTVFVPHTKIRLIDGEQTIVGQIVVTMEFHVASN